MLKKIFFSFRFAYRSITRNIISSITLFFTIFIISFLSFAVFGFSTIIDEFFIAMNTKIYTNMDIMITPDINNGEIVIDTLKIENIDFYFDYIDSEFEFNTSINYDDEKYSYSITGIDYKEFNKRYGSNFSYILSNECIVPEKILTVLNKNIGDTISLEIAGKSVNLTIKDVILSESDIPNSIYMDRSALLRRYSIEQFGIDLSNSANINLASVINLKVKDGVNINEVLEILNSEELYKNSIVEYVYDTSRYQANINIIISLVYAAFLVFSLSLSYIVVTISNIRIKKNKNVIATLESLGASKSYYYFVYFIEILIYSFVSVFISRALIELIFSIIIKSQDYIYRVVSYKFYIYLLSFLIPLLLSSLSILLVRIKNKNTSLSLSLKDKAKDKGASIKVFIILSIALSIILLLFVLFVRGNILDKYYYSIIVLLVILLQIFIIPLIYRVILLLFKGNNLFRYISYNVLKNSSIKITSLITIALSIAGIILSFSIVSTINNNMEQISTFTNIDYCIFNIDSLTDDDISTINEYSEDVKTNKAIIKRSIADTNKDNYYNIYISCDISDFERLFKCSISDNTKEIFNDEKRSCIINKNVLISSGYNIGDSIDLVINNNVYSYEIVDCLDLDSDYYIYTNEYYLDNFELNTLLVECGFDKLEKNKFKNFLYTNYGSKLVYLTDLKGDLVNFVKTFRSTVSTAYFVIIALIASFIMSIINNNIIQFIDDIKNYAVYKALGLNNKMMHKVYIMEAIVTFITILLPVIVVTVISLKYYGYISLLFGSYARVNVKTKEYIIEIIISIITFILSYIYNFLGYNKVNVTKELKSL